MSAQTMKAARFTDDGAPENMYLEEVPTPKLQRMEVLIKVHSTSVNRADTIQVCQTLNSYKIVYEYGSLIFLWTSSIVIYRNIFV